MSSSFGALGIRTALIYETEPDILDSFRNCTDIWGMHLIKMTVCCRIYALILSVNRNFSWASV